MHNMIIDINLFQILKLRDAVIIVLCKVSFNDSSRIRSIAPQSLQYLVSILSENTRLRQEQSRLKNKMGKRRSHQ